MAVDGQLLAGEAIGISEGTDATFEAALEDAAQKLYAHADDRVKLVVVEIIGEFGGFAAPASNEIQVKVRRLE